MIFRETRLAGAFVVEPQIVEDARGFFARSWCQRELESQSLNPRLVQCSISFNKKRGTLRGLHYQAAPYQETKLVRCTMGQIYDVIVDLRPESATFKQHLAVILSAHNHKMIYVPEGFAHGFLTLADDTEVFYQMSEFYSPEHAKGISWNDPAFGIEWPLTPCIMSDRDRSYSNFTR